jgi:chromosome segregation ATPase
MDNLAQTIAVALTGLKEFEIAAPAHVGLEERVAHARAELKATEQKLAQCRAELSAARQALDKAQAEHVRRHHDQMDEKHSSQRECEIAIGEANTKLASLEAQIREKQAEHHAVVLGLDAVKQRLNV